jgi:predicted O-methyltransferase YrrM
MEFDEVAAKVAGIPYMSPSLGRRVYDHIRRTRPTEVLELGSAHGVGTAYMAAALAANGSGHITTVDYGAADFDPAPLATLERAGLAERATIVHDHSSYNWYLAQAVREATDAHGNVTPSVDFCYLDGSKNFSVDGLAAVLVEKLLRPGGWLLMDDLEWTYDSNPWIAPSGDGKPFAPLSQSERTEPNLLAVFELIVSQMPSMTQLIVEDAWWGWAQKDETAPRRMQMRASRPPLARINAELRRRARRARRAG